MAKQTRLTDAEKLKCFDHIRNLGNRCKTMTAWDMASELAALLGRPVSNEIARHQVRVCGMSLKGTRRQHPDDVLNAICDALELIASNDPCVHVERAVQRVSRLLGRDSSQQKGINDVGTVKEKGPDDCDRWSIRNPCVRDTW